jgi:hypothetical protein
MTYNTRYESRCRCFFERSTLAKRRHGHREEAALQIQGWWRARFVRHLAMLQVEREAAASAIRLAATCRLQRVYRGFRGRKVARNMRREEAAATTLQKHYRATMARRLVARHRLEAWRVSPSSTFYCHGDTGA